MLWKKDEPIIKELLEIDVYKLLMLCFIDRFYPNLKVKFAFKNRTTKVRLEDYIHISQLNEEFAHVASLRFTEKDVAYLRSWGVFPEHFLRSLPGRRLPEIIVGWAERTHDFRIEAEGSWPEATLWETFVLAIVSELYARGYAKKHDLSEEALAAEGMRRLDQKLDALLAYRLAIFAQFGLRRRAGGAWEEWVTRCIVERAPRLMAGISNVRLARDFGYEALGTNAHELPMGVYALRRHENDDAVRQAPYEVLKKWQMLFGHRLLIMLPDAFWSPAFYEGLPRQYLVDWRGSRQDSGDPFGYGEMMLKLYKKHGIDPKDKLIIFSDGLDVEKMIGLHKRFSPEIGVSFGWGTNLTNDVGIPPLSLVMKLVEAAGNPAVKLSDNVAKATGPAEEVQVAKRIFGYRTAFFEVPTY